MPNKKHDEDEMDDAEIMDEILDGYKAAKKIGDKLFGSVTLTQARELYGLMDDDPDEDTFEEFEDELRECQASLIASNLGTVTFDDVVGLYVDTFLGDLE